MQIGCCIPGGSFMPQDDGPQMDALTRLIEGARIILDSGFDFVEGTVGMVMALSEEQLEKAAGAVRLFACNSFIPGVGTVIAGGESLEKYAHEAMRRLHILSCPMVVFGSGRARNIPETMSREEGMDRIRAFLRICQRAGDKYGVDTVLEPLNHAETNVWNLVSEATETARSLKLPRICVLADAYHMAAENEPLPHLSEAGGLLHHIHVSEADRSAPGKTDRLRAFGQCLNSIGYAGGVSAECVYTDFAAECPKAARYMREVFQ